MRKPAILFPTVIALVALAAIAPNGPASGADPHGVRSEPLSRGTFPDDIDVKIKLKQDGAETRVIDVRDPSDILVARITLAAGGTTGWHTHPGPVLATVHSGTITIVNADDCLRRTYRAGQAFIDPGRGNVHVGLNDTDEETVVYATFLEVPDDGKATIPVDDPGTCDL